MECITTSKGSQWVLYHLKKLGRRGQLIDSIKRAEPSPPWGERTTYVMTSMPPSLPPWGTLWVCGVETNPLDNSLPDYTKEILRGCLDVLDLDLARWLLIKYQDYPEALGRLVLQVQVLAMGKGGVLYMEDVLPLVLTLDSTPFLWSYQTTIGKPEGLPLIYNATNADLWKAFMLDVGLQKYLKTYHHQLVYSLSLMRENVDRGMGVLDSAILWHLSTLPSGGDRALP